MATMAAEARIAQCPGWAREASGRVCNRDGPRVAFVSDRRGRNDAYIRRADGTSRAELLVDREATLSRRQNAKPCPPPNAIGLEVVVVNGEDRGQRFSLGKTNQGGIGEIHRAICVPLHESFKVGGVDIRDREQRHGARTKEAPGPLDVLHVRSEEMEELGENRRGRG